MSSFRSPPGKIPLPDKLLVQTSWWSADCSGPTTPSLAPDDFPRYSYVAFSLDTATYAGRFPEGSEARKVIESFPVKQYIGMVHEYVPKCDFRAQPSMRVYYLSSSKPPKPLEDQYIEISDGLYQWTSLSTYLAFEDSEKPRIFLSAEKMAEWKGVMSTHNLARTAIHRNLPGCTRYTKEGCSCNLCRLSNREFDNPVSALVRPTTVDGEEMGAPEDWAKELEDVRALLQKYAEDSP